MDNAIKGFCDYVSRQGQVDLEYCGINENNEFFYNHQVAPAPLARRRLIDGMKKHSQLIHLANRVVITRADVAAYYSSPSVPQQGGYSLQATGYGYSASIGGVAYRPLMPAASAPYAGSLGTSYSPFTPPAPSFHTGGLGGTLSSPLMPTPTTNAVIRGESPAVMFTPAPQANLYSTFASASATPLLPSSTGPVYQNAEDTSTEIRVLPGSVVRINNPLGIGQVIEHLDLGKKSYGIVNSIDKLGELQAGVAKDIKRVVGSNYERVIRDRQTGVHGNCRVNYGECFTYDCSFNSWSKPQKLNNCRLVLNVLVPFSVNPKFDLHLKNSILKVLEEAAQYGINRLYFPLLGCGRAGGNGRQLAKAIYEAKRDFESCNDQKAPKIFLVSRGSPSEQRTCVDFDDQWSTLMASSVPSSTPSSSARRSKSPAPSRASSGAAANASPSGAGLSSRPRPAASLSPVASTPSTSRSDSPVSIKRDTAQARVDADARSQRARRSKSPAPSRASSGAAANASSSGAGLSSSPRPAASLSPVASTPSTSKPDFPVSIKRDTAQARVDADARSQTARRSKSPAPSRASSGAAANVSSSGAGLSSSPRPAASLSPVASTPSTPRSDSPVSIKRDTAQARVDADARSQTARRSKSPAPSRASSGAAANVSSSGAGLSSSPRPAASLSPVASTPSTSKPDFPVSIKRDTAQARVDADARSQRARRSKSPAPSRASSGAAANVSPSGAGLSSSPRPAASLSPVASTLRPSMPDFPVSARRDTAQARVDADARSQTARRSKSPAPSRASSGAAANVSPSGAGLSSSPGPAASLSPVASTLSTSRPDFPVSARRDTARADADLGRVVPRAQSSFEPQSGLSYIETSLGDRVELVKSNRGIEDFVRLQYFTEPYGIVNSIDKFGHFRGGVAKAIADMAGDRYAETISEMQNSDDPSEQLSYGQCVTYELKRSGKTSDLEKLQTVHSVLIPFSEDPSFDEHLKDSILRVFEEAVQHELDLIIFPLLGCGRAGGTGGQLAQAVYAARRDFKSRSGKEAPKMVLVGSNSLADQKTVEDFKCKCSVIAPAHDLVALNTRRAGSAVPFRASSGATANTSPSEAELSSRSRPSASSVAGTLRPSRSDYPVSARRDTDRARVGVDARSRSRRLELPTPSRSRSGAAASSGTTEASRDDSAVSPKVLISDQLEVVMHPNGGMFGYAKELSSRGEAFDLVNAANGYMAHNGGIAAQFKKDLGSGFEEDTKKLAQQRPEGEVPAGQCITTGAYNYAENQSLGLMNCQHIHHVVAPIRQRFDPQQYNEAFKEAFVSLLLAANENGGNTIVSCFIGCAIFGGSGHDMACALHAAYHDSRVTSLSKVPKLILSGWEKTDSATIGDDRRVYDDFIQTFEALNAEKPVHLPSGITPVASSTDISETAFPAGAGAIQKTPSSGASAFPVASSLSASRSDSSGSVGKDIGLIRDDGVSEEPLTNGITLVRLGIGGELEDYLGLFYKNKSYGIVNSIDSLRRLEDDVAKAIRDMAGGHQKKMNGRLNPSNQPDQEEFGQCVTCEFGHSGKTAKLAHLKTIHNVLIPSPENSDFEKLLKESILGIFKEAEQHKIDILVSPFLGCRFGEFGETDARLLARAIYAARYAFELRYFKKAPEMLLVGKGSALDEGNFACFEREWAGLHQLGSTTLSSTRKEPAAGVARVSETADITSTAPRGKTIECGNCHETKAEANSKTIAGTPICSGCIDEFVAEGVDFARMDDKYNAIEYEPFQPHEVEGESVPGYPDVGLIKVCLGGTGPEYLDGRKLNVFSKSHQAYFPNNRIGRELVRIFSVLHEKKLIYVIDESKTLGCMGDSPLVRPDFHNRKVDLTERGFFFRTAVGKKIFFADLDEEGFKKYGIERSFGLTFNVHFKTSLFGPHGYERDDGTIDYDYFGRVLNEIEDIAKARGIRDELGLDNLVALLTSDAIDEGKGGS